MKIQGSAGLWPPPGVEIWMQSRALMAPLHIHCPPPLPWPSHSQCGHRQHISLLLLRAEGPSLEFPVSSTLVSTHLQMSLSWSNASPFSAPLSRPSCPAYLSRVPLIPYLTLHTIHCQKNLLKDRPKRKRQLMSAPIQNKTVQEQRAFVLANWAHTHSICLYWVCMAKPW